MDEVLERQRSRVRVGVGSAVVLLLVGLGCAVLVSLLGAHGGTQQVVPVEVTASAGPEAGALIMVHVLGQVAHPGLYELRDGDRAIDAVAAAGGLTDAADPAGLNLARFVTDAEQLYVPAVGETPAAGSAAASSTVNLNTADAAELDTLPRVGPAMAARIIAWREQNGPFTSVEDLLNVTGVGQKTFDGLKDLVSV